MLLQAIETVYNGYRFRSRLEARWAVFFDALDMRWEYEKEGYDLGIGWYLPDFWLTKRGRYGWEGGEAVSVWAEVKPERFTAIEIERCKRLVAMTQADCIMLVGLPEPEVYYAIEYDPQSRMAIDSVDLLLHSSKNRFWWSPGEEDIEYLRNENREYQYACDAARQARFEHGKTPR